MPSSYSGSPVSENGSSRPSSITRSSRESFVAELETLPPENVESTYELDEEVLDIEDLSDNEQDSSMDNLSESSSSSSIKAVEDEVNKGIKTGKQEASPVESELDYKIRKGLEKVKKLDKILLERTEKEKEVKQSRRIAEKEFQSQVAQLIQEKGADKVWGSQQLLYLCASSDKVEHGEMDDIIEPIFPTQIDIEYYKDRVDSIPNGTTKADSKVKDTQNEEKTDIKQKKEKDFVKRNVGLASHAQELILLTDEERKRLDELLADDTDLLMVENPFSSSDTSISGYQFSNEEKNVLEKIDSQLKELVPSDELTLAIVDSQLNVDNSNFRDSSSGRESLITSNEEGVICEPKCGENVLQKCYDERMVLCRLRDIDSKLKYIQCNEERAEAPLDPDLLRKLLDVDSRLTSHSVSICESLLSNTASCCNDYNDTDTAPIGSEYEIGLDQSHSQLYTVTN